MAVQLRNLNIRLSLDNAIGAAAQSKILVNAARAKRDELIRTDQASPVYRLFVDGTEKTSEDGARHVITYKFSRLAYAAAYALGYAKARSPKASGEYRNAWLVLVNGRKWGGQEDPIPAGATVMLVNPVPYARKIDVGGMKMSVPPGIVEDTRQAVQRAYPGVVAERDFVLLSGGIDPRAPYTLKRQGIESGLTYHKTHGFLRKHAPKLSRRKDRAAGMPLTYPALILTDR